LPIVFICAPLKFPYIIFVNMTIFKAHVLEKCKAVINEKIARLQFDISEIDESMSNETKSSAGDKHETARARMQSEHEKLSRQLDELKTQVSVLNKIDLRQSSKTISIGNLVQTNKNCFFISIPLGKIVIDAKEVYIISPDSPLGKKFLGLEVLAEVKMNESNYIIDKIY